MLKFVLVNSFANFNQFVSYIVRSLSAGFHAVNIILKLDPALITLVFLIFTVLTRKKSLEIIRILLGKFIDVFFRLDIILYTWILKSS
jgi:hypothetical protein